MNKTYYILLISILFTQETIVNKIVLQGLITTNAEEIYRHSGLHPSETFDDENSNNQYDSSENFFDSNNDGKYNLGTNIVRGDEFNSAITNLWKLNVFSDIKISVEDSYSNLNGDIEFLDLIIQLDELPIIEDIKIFGNRKLKDKLLLELIKLQKFRRVSLDDIYTAKDIIRTEYKKKNFHNVNIDVQLEEGENDFSKIVNINITEGKKTKIQDIKFFGNDSFKKGKLIKNFQHSKEQTFLMFWKGKFDSANLKTDLKNLEIFYKNNGYRDAQIILKEVNYLDNGIYIEISIEEGKKNYYRNFNFEGNYKFTDSELIESLKAGSSELPLSSGDIYNEQLFNLCSYNLNKKYMDEGYYFIQIQTEIFPISDNMLDVNFKIEESDKTKIRKIFVSGNDKTYDNVILREMKIHPGDTFNMDKLEESYKSIFMLNYFESVDPQIITIDNSTEYIDIDFKVIEKETGRANFSMGYNEVHGLTGGGGFDFSNFRGMGQYLSINYNRGLQNQNQFSGQSTSNSNNNDFQSFSISFTEPRIYDTRNSIGFSFSHSEQGRGSNSLLKYDIVSDRSSIFFGRKFDWPDYYFRGSWSLSMKSTKYIGSLDTLQDDFDSTDITQDDEYNGSASKRGVSLSQTITRDSRNHPEFPTSGSKFTWASTLSGDILGGHENYHKHVFNFEWYNGLIGKKPGGVFEIAVYQNFKFGALMELEENQFIPYNARFVLGGTGTPYGEMLRGYPDNSIGPKRNTGVYYNFDGGKVLFKYSAEVRFRISESPAMHALVFAEVGNIWSDFDTVDIFDLKRSLGFGVRVNMPMLGTLGYDIGYGFDSIYDDPTHSGYNEPYGWEHHLLFGIPMN